MLSTPSILPPSIGSLFFRPAVFVFSYCHTSADATRSQSPSTPQSSDRVPVRRELVAFHGTPSYRNAGNLPALFFFLGNGQTGMSNLH